VVVVAVATEEEEVVAVAVAMVGSPRLVFGRGGGGGAVLCQSRDRTILAAHGTGTLLSSSTNRPLLEW